MESDSLPPEFAHVPFVLSKLQDDPQMILRRLGFAHPRPALFVSGGARQLAAEHEELAAELLRGVARAAAALGLALVTGGTNSGVMALLGAACAALPQPPSLIGVLPSGMLAQRGAAILEQNHTHFLLVEGEQWGAESGWLARLALGADRRTAPLPRFVDQRRTGRAARYHSGAGAGHTALGAERQRAAGGCAGRSARGRNSWRRRYARRDPARTRAIAVAGNCGRYRWRCRC